MRNAIAAVIAVVAAALVYCAYISSRSDRDIAPKVTTFLVSLLPPVIGNLIIIVAHTEGFALFGRYLYAAGIDIAIFCLLDFTLQYCGLSWNKTSSFRCWSIWTVNSLRSKGDWIWKR